MLWARPAAGRRCCQRLPAGSPAARPRPLAEGAALTIAATRRDGAADRARTSRASRSRRCRPTCSCCPAIAPVMWIGMVDRPARAAPRRCPLAPLRRGRTGAPDRLRRPRRRRLRRSRPGRRPSSPLAGSADRLRASTSRSPSLVGAALAGGGRRRGLRRPAPAPARHLAARPGARPRRPPAARHPHPGRPPRRCGSPSSTSGRATRPCCSLRGERRCSSTADRRGTAAADALA